MSDTPSLELIRLLMVQYQTLGNSIARKAAWRIEELERELATARYETAIKCAEMCETQATNWLDGRTINEASTLQKSKWSVCIVLRERIRAFANTLKGKP